MNRVLNLVASIGLSVLFTHVALADQIAEQMSAQQPQNTLPVATGPATLTISGKEHWYQQHYDSGDSPAVSAYDVEGNLLPDGLYRYEFKSLPPSAGGGGLSGGQPKDMVNINKQKPTQIISGSFRISGGTVISN